MPGSGGDLIQSAHRTGDFAELARRPGERGFIEASGDLGNITQLARLRHTARRSLRTQEQGADIEDVLGQRRQRPLGLPLINPRQPFDDLFGQLRIRRRVGHHLGHLRQTLPGLQRPLGVVNKAGRIQCLQTLHGARRPPCDPPIDITTGPPQPGKDIADVLTEKLVKLPIRHDLQHLIERLEVPQRLLDHRLVGVGLVLQVPHHRADIGSDLLQILLAVTADEFKEDPHDRADRAESGQQPPVRVPGVLHPGGEPLDRGRHLLTPPRHRAERLDELADHRLDRLALRNLLRRNSVIRRRHLKADPVQLRCKRPPRPRRDPHLGRAATGPQIPHQQLHHRPQRRLGHTPTRGTWPTRRTHISRTRRRLQRLRPSG